jgi:hypothetical protein
MPGWIGLIVIAANFVVALRKPKAGVWIYLVLIFTLPHSQIVGRSVSYDILGFIPLLISVLFVNENKIKNPNLLYVITPLYPALMVFSTWISSTFYGFSIEPLLLFGVIRFCFLLYIFIEILDEKYIYNALIIIVGINFFTCLYQLYNPQESIDLFYRLYGKETHAVLEGYYDSGSFARPTGTLLSPVDVGVLVIISYSICLHNIFKRGGRFKNYATLILIIATGIVSLTKTALLGIPLLTLFFVVASFVTLRPRSIYKVRIKATNIFVYSILTLSLVWVVYSIYNFMQKSGYGYQIIYYASFLVDPLEAFESRYSERGQLGETIDVSLRYPFFGLGATRAQGEFLGDSTLIRVIHATGIFGLLVHISIYLYILYTIVYKSDIAKILVLSSIFMSGFALFTFYTKYGAVVLSYCLISGDD